MLVNTAGRLENADTVRFEHMSADAAIALLAVDVVGAMRMCQAVIPHMRRHGHGVIINFSSTYGNGVNPENAINWVPVTYCTAKAAIRGLTASLARDVTPEIRVNALAPGPISGNWEQEWGVAPEHIEEAKAMNPMKRFGDPREIAETVLFLAADGAGYINGQVIHVEGGWVPNRLALAVTGVCRTANLASLAESCVADPDGCRGEARGPWTARATRDPDARIRAPGIPLAAPCLARQG